MEQTFVCCHRRKGCTLRHVKVLETAKLFHGGAAHVIGRAAIKVGPLRGKPPIDLIWRRPRHAIPRSVEHSPPGARLETAKNMFRSAMSTTRKNARQMIRRRFFFQIRALGRGPKKSPNGVQNTPKTCPRVAPTTRGALVGPFWSLFGYILTCAREPLKLTSFALRPKCQKTTQLGSKRLSNCSASSQGDSRRSVGRCLDPVGTIFRPSFRWPKKKRPRTTVRAFFGAVEITPRNMLFGRFRPWGPNHRETPRVGEDNERKCEVSRLGAGMCEVARGNVRTTLRSNIDAYGPNI